MSPSQLEISYSYFQRTFFNQKSKSVFHNLHDPAALAGGYDSDGGIGKQCRMFVHFLEGSRGREKRNVILALHYLPVIELTVFKLRGQGQGE